MLGFYSWITVEKSLVVLGGLFHHKKADLSEGTNFISLAASFIAQALGSFIRDEIFNPLASRINGDIFPEYGKYIATGILFTEIIQALLKSSTNREK
eukprot:snap_masked-scaffold_6-processed-gene-0.35-mRNA-1 protein AED:1.00 eAED:1.00 QI:0/0/0/0/1/1/2/0/96